MTCIVVMGMHRSGTSLVSRILSAGGVHMGDAFRLPDAGNSDGYGEDLDWRAVNKWILNNAGGTWYDPPSLRETRVEAERISYILEALIEKKSEKKLWGFKDPRTCLTIHGIHKLLPNPRYVFVTRNERDVIKSLSSRAERRCYSEPEYHWRQLCWVYGTRMARFVRSNKIEKWVVEYEKLVNEKTAESVIANLYDFARCKAQPSAGMQLVRFRS